MQILGVDKFELVKLLRMNRNVVLFCTLRAKAQSDVERRAIDVKMAQDEDLAPILAEIRDSKQVDKADGKTKKVATRAGRLDQELDVTDAAKDKAKVRQSITSTHLI